MEDSRPIYKNDVKSMSQLHVSSKGNINAFVDWSMIIMSICLFLRQSKPV